MQTIIAIDGPAGAGKSTIAKLIAQKLNLLYIDTGAMYRCVALLSMNNNLKISSLEDKIKLVTLSKNSEIVLKQNEVYLNKQNVTEKIREPQINRIVSDISSIPEIRSLMVDKQRELGKSNNSILDGRDIGTTVFPEATYKFFLTASIEERASRRAKQQISQGIEQSIEEIKQDILQRDYTDSHREHSPLKKAEDAILIDTDLKSIEEVVEIILNYIKLQNTF